MNDGKLQKIDTILAFLMPGIIIFTLCLSAKKTFLDSLILGLFTGMLGLLIYAYSELYSTRKPHQKFTSYKYKWQRHHFDNWQYFTIDAGSEAEADKKAQEHFDILLQNSLTVTTTFYRAN